MNNNNAVTAKNIGKSFDLHNKDRSLKTKLINFASNRKAEKRSYNQVLKNVSFEINKGDFFAIVGRNGSGKSTLLKIIAGVYSVDDGTININGKLVPFIELGVGFNPELTGKDNVYLNGALLGFSRREIDVMYQDIVEFAELKDFMNEKLKNYSSGMQVRLAFSIAIRAESDILLIDEVLAVGDAVFQEKCFKYFRKLKEEKKTVIFVSHDTELVKRYCNQGMLINKGKIVKIGGIEEVMDAYGEELSESQHTNNVTATDQTNKPVKKVKIKSVTLVNNNQQTRTINFMQDLQFIIKLKFKKNYKPENINIALGIYDGLYDAGGNYEIGVSSQLDGKKINPTSELHSLTIKKPPLKKGTHYVYLSVFSDSEEVPYDYKSEAVVFRVVDGPIGTSRGTILAKHSWS